MANEDIGSDENMDPMEDIVNIEPKQHKTHQKAHSHHAHSHVAEKHEHEHHKSCCSGGKGLWIAATIIMFVAAVLFLVLWITKDSGNGVSNSLNEEQISVEMKKFIDENLIQPGMSSKIESVKDINGVYEVIVSVQGQNVTSYASKDGKIFFPSGYILEEIEAYVQGQKEQQTQQQEAQSNVPKTDKPAVDVFVMSHCPYGTQIEKGLLPVVELLGDKADIKIKFVNYAMHGEKEINEQLNQYCIQEVYSDKYYKYLQCFLADGDSARCIKELGFDQTKIDSCVSATDEEFGISDAYADKSTWRGSFPSFGIYEEENTKYGVQGSPTLVINGVQISSARDSESLKNTICNAFNVAPEECSETLSTASPSAGFGFGTSGTDAAAAGCGV